MKNLATLLKRHRVKSGLSQYDLGRKIGWSNGQYISNYERSVSAVPLQSIKPIADILKVDNKKLWRAWRIDMDKVLEDALDQ